MPRLTKLLPLALATLSVAALQAQADPAGQTTSPQTPPAPIVRTAPEPEYPAQAPRHAYRPYRGNYSATLSAGQVLHAADGTANAQPVPGVYVRVAMGGALREVAADEQHAEFRVERGVVNISVHHPEEGKLLLVDLPGGQVQMLKNGLYTFNAATDTARVLKGEANAFAASAPPATKPIKVKEDKAVTFPPAGSAVAKLRAHDFYPFQIGSDLIPQPYNEAQLNDGPGYGYGYPPYYGFYGGPWGYPYYAWSPYWDGGFYGYPWGFGLGYGGFYGGGFYGRGFYGGGHFGGGHDGGGHGGGGHGR
ncbi:hypothetical protein GOB94_08750 [Granulicella sp. 5B5]|uniref:hypothetical protein n=1 Tax=Granulicella sp. 5B5 TaxID=1617967 RepID=UPI0015F35497|nr:hypothetical protein [Granulicella sp. 5B5]QMV18760.1 hypothetical protein GOB94_08750 [Granulicella sp. 5B5]